MRAKISWLLSATLLLGAAAATAQSFPCASVAPEVRERVREAGACRDATLGDAAPKDAAPASSAVTVRLSDGTVVRVPREISSSIRNERKGAAVDKTAARAGASTQSEPGASGDPAPALQKLKVPDVIGRSYADAGRALAEFKVDRIETVNAAPSGEVVAQEPAPATLMLPGSTVNLQVSDGSLASGAGTNPVTAPATAAAAASTPVPATDSALASAAAPVPASEPTVPPGPRGRFPIAFSANAALILGAGVLLGLLFGALLMRQWLLRRGVAADENAAPPTLSQHQQPVETGAVGVSETGAAPEIRFAARRDPGETTIVLAPLPDGDEVAIERSSDHLPNDIRLHAPIEVTGDDVERALFEQSKDEVAVARLFDRLRGPAAERAAEELNHALEVDIFDVLAQGWARVPAVRTAVQLSALMQGPSALVNLDRHNLGSTSRLVLDGSVAQSALPPLELTLEIVTDVQTATLAAREGRIELVALGEACVIARLKYKSVLVKEHATGFSGVPRDPFQHRPSVLDREASVDIQI
jgi:hypothetical protein